MAPVARRAQLFTNAYRLAKLSNAAEEFLEEVFSPKGGASPSSPSTSAPAAPGQQRQDGSLVQGFTAAYRRAQAAYGQQLTQQIMITGAAMAPTLNKAALSDPTAVERLVLRLLRRPSSRSVQVGDVVAFYSPLAPADAQHVMVRRVAAVEGQEMVSGSDEEQSFSIPRDHCWVGSWVHTVGELRCPSPHCVCVCVLAGPKQLGARRRGAGYAALLSPPPHRTHCAHVVRCRGWQTCPCSAGWVGLGGGGGRRRTCARCMPLVEGVGAGLGGAQDAGGLPVPHHTPPC